MNFKHWLEQEKSYIRSPEFAKKITRYLAGKNIEVDGRIEIDWRDPLAYYRIFDVDEKLVKSGAINFSSFSTQPSDAVYYIVYELAKQNGINYPANTILNNGELASAGTSQPKLDKELIKKYWDEIRKWL